MHAQTGEGYREILEAKKYIFFLIYKDSNVTDTISLSNCQSECYP
jgi:hypothetical protein